MAEPRSTRARAAEALLWCLLATLAVAWAAFLWHPWIDWFGRPR